MNDWRRYPLPDQAISVDFITTNPGSLIPCWENMNIPTIALLTIAWLVRFSAFDQQHKVA
jgi:hypothetical protein